MRQFIEMCFDPSSPMNARLKQKLVNDDGGGFMNRKTSVISVQDTDITIITVDQKDYISLTDMAKARSDATRAADVIKNWLRNRSTLEFLGTWEMI